MNLLTILAILGLAAGFGYVTYLNLDMTTYQLVSPPAKFVKPPYAFSPGDAVSELNAFFFVFLFSLLFFGISAPVGLFYEGMKFASLMAVGTNAYDFAFVIPEILAAYAAILLGQGVWQDFGGKDNVYSTWAGAFKVLGAALALTVLLILVRPYIVHV